MQFAGREITHRFSDVRQAVAYALSVRRGPQHRRMAWGTVRVHGDRDAGHAVMAAVRGDLGIEPDTPEWAAMEAWALADGPTPPWVRTKLRPILGQAGLLDDQPETDTVKLELEDVTWVDDDGTEYATVREVR